MDPLSILLFNLSTYQLFKSTWRSLASVWRRDEGGRQEIKLLRRCGSLVQCLPGMCKALSSTQQGGNIVNFPAETMSLILPSFLPALSPLPSPHRMAIWLPRRSLLLFNGGTPQKPVIKSVCIPRETQGMPPADQMAGD